MKKEVKITAHSIQQYNKWKDYLTGNKHEADYFILAQTYINDFYRLFGYSEIHSRSNNDLFTEFAKLIQPPKNTL